MKFADVLRKECIAADVTLADKADALVHVSRLAKNSPALAEVDQKEILDALKAREALGSTGIGKGVAIPHCRLSRVKEFVVGIITVPEGVDFDALDGEKVRLIVFIIAPEARSNAHIRLLSAISQALLAPDAVDKILAQHSPEAVYQSFLQKRDDEINARDHKLKSLVHIFVQNEQIFRDLIQLLVGLEGSSLAVVAAENAGTYLAKMPLYASFWHDRPSSFSRIIIAVVDRKLTNETVRRIESITGDLRKTASVMVTVQEISIALGSLNT